MGLSYRIISRQWPPLSFLWFLLVCFTLVDEKGQDTRNLLQVVRRVGREKIRGYKLSLFFFFLDENDRLDFSSIRSPFRHS